MNEVILDNLVSEDLPRVKETIRDGIQRVSGGAAKKIEDMGSLYETVIAALSDGTRNTPVQLTYLDAFEQAVGVFRASSLELRKAMNILTLEQRIAAAYQLRDQLTSVSADKPGDKTGLEQEASDARFFSNRYALYFAGNIGLALLGSEPAPVSNLFSFGTRLDTSTDQRVLTRALAMTASIDLQHITKEKTQKGEHADDDVLKYTLEAIFTSWVNQFDWRTFSRIAEQRGVEDMKLRYGNFSVHQGAFKQKHDLVVLDDRIMDARREEVIGGQELGSLLWKSMIKLSAYDHERKKNPHAPPGVIFTYGEPGTGKTFNAHAHIRSFGELCRTKGVPFWAFVHSTTDYASHYQNKTANELAALAQRIKEFPGPVVMYVADADNIFQSRKDPRLGAEQQQTLSVYFKMFDGQLVPKNGKFMAIMDANYLTGIDDATKSRLFDEIIELRRFDQSEQFSELLRRSLNKDVSLAIAPEQWNDLGAYLLKTPLSNREIGHVIGQLRRGFDVPEEMVGASFEQHRDYRSAQLIGITPDKIRERFDTYIETRMDIERKAQLSRESDDLDRFLMYLARKAPETAAAGGV
ncbi:AAA family ATPase [Candidatus Pacearchaeota archaeon]|nr:AAA family ATPase [Candidatus Pacearchaeota archaeon]